MNETTYFVRPCPNCARQNPIPIDRLGQQFGCQHCGREFTACDPHAESAALDDPVQYWVHYTEHEFDEHGEFVERYPR